MNEFGELSKYNNLKIKNVPQDTVSIGNKHYKVINGIFHHGNSISSGHYTNMLRDKNKWLQINDLQVEPSLWPSYAQDAYLLFLEEIDENLIKTVTTQEFNKQYAQKNDK